MAMLDLCSKITDTIDSKTFCAGIFIDLSKTFDTISHSILFGKLQHYGVRGVPLQQFTSYLCDDRKQYVLYNGQHSSKMANITCEVPQGSILGTYCI